MQETWLSNFLKAVKGEELKTLTATQMLHRFPIAFALIKTANTSGNLLNEIHQVIYSLYQAKEINKKVYTNIMNSIKL